MENDGCTPSVKRIKSFLGMVFSYPYFIPSCSSIAKPQSLLTVGQKFSKDKNFHGTYRKLTTSGKEGAEGSSFMLNLRQL